MTNRDPIEQLTIAELDEGSRRLKADLVTAISQNTENRWQALAIVAWLATRREDRAAQLNTYRAMTTTELTDALGMTDDDQVDQVVVTGPQLWAAADELGVELVALCAALGVDAVEPPAALDDAEAISEDPTDPAPAP